MAVFNGVTASALGGRAPHADRHPRFDFDVVAVTIVAADARGCTRHRQAFIRDARPSVDDTVGTSGDGSIIRRSSLMTDGTNRPRMDARVEVNVTRIGGDATPRDTATVTFPDQSFRFQHDGPDVGKALISGVEMRDVGRRDDAATPPLTHFSFNITIGPGDFITDACGCAHCVRRPPTYAHPRGCASTNARTRATIR